MLFLLFSLALAQDEAVTPQINSQNYRPPVDSDQTMWVDDAGLVRDQTFFGRYRLVFGYTNSPLVYRTDAGDTTVLVKDVLQANLTGSATLFGRARIGVDLPIYMLSTGAAYDGSAAGLGDVALDLRGTMIDRADHPVGLALGARFALPTGSLSGLSTGGLGWEVQAIADRQFTDEFLMAVNLGTRGLPAVELDNVDWNDQFFFRLGGGYSITDAVGASVDFAGTVNYGGGADLVGIPIEGMLGGWGRPSDGPLVVRGGVGTGLTPGLGSPVFRGVLMLAYEPTTARDTDMDGIVDKEDHCVDEPEDLDDFQDFDGCPEPDNDLDTVLDVDDLCPLQAEDLDEFDDGDGCPDPSTSVSFTITDDKGNLLGQALVEVSNDVERHVDTRGSFVQPFHPGRFKLLAEAEGFHENAVEFEVPADESYQVSLALKPRIVLGRLKFKVQNTEGQPVEATWQVDGGQEATVPGEGTQVTLTPGKHEVWVHADGYAPSRMAVEIEQNETTNLMVMLQPSKAQLVGERIDIKERVFFDTGKSSIKPVSFGLLDEVAAILVRHTELTKLRVEGHTDKVGSGTANQRLSEARARAVADYLEEAGVESARLQAVGLGEEVPLVDEDTPEAYAQNRRVEFHVAERSDVAPK